MELTIEEIELIDNCASVDEAFQVTGDIAAANYLGQTHFVRKGYVIHKRDGRAFNGHGEYSGTKAHVKAKFVQVWNEEHEGVAR